MVGCESKQRTPKRHVLKRDWTTCSKLVNHSRHKSQHNWGEGTKPTKVMYDLYDHYVHMSSLGGKWLMKQIGFVNYPTLSACSIS